MKIYYSSIFLLITLTHVIYAQEYYPLKNGNKWFYRISASTYPNPYDPSNDDTSFVQVLSDTLIINGKKYHTLSRNDVVGRRYLRVDSNYIYYNINGLDSTEIPYFNLRATIGDTLRLSNSGPYGYTLLTKIDTLLIFGVKSRVLTFSMEGFTKRVVKFSDKYGPVTRWSYGDPPAPWPDISEEIIGCKLNDTTYGYALSVSSPNVNLVSFNLNQNYPNPFNPSTTIQYSLPVSSLTTLQIIDMLGRTVRTVVNEFQNSGEHAVSVNVADLPSGVYYYQLRSGSFVQTKKMMLLK